MREVLLEMNDFEATREIRASFALSGFDCDPEKLTKEFGIEPNWTRNVKKKGPWNVWGISTKGIIHSMYVEDHLMYLLDKLEPIAPEMQKYADDFAVSITCRIFREADCPFGLGQIDIPTDLLICISHLCKTVVVSYLCVDEEEEEL